MESHAMTLLRHTVILPCKRIARYTMYYTCIHIFWAWFFACVRTPQSYRVEYWMRKEHLPLPLYWIILIRGELICLELSFERIYCVSSLLPLLLHHHHSEHHVHVWICPFSMHCMHWHTPSNISYRLDANIKIFMWPNKSRRFIFNVKRNLRENCCCYHHYYGGVETCESWCAVAVLPLRSFSCRIQKNNVLGYSILSASEAH